MLLLVFAVVGVVGVVGVFDDFDADAMRARTTSHGSRSMLKRRTPLHQST